MNGAVRRWRWAWLLLLGCKDVSRREVPALTDVIRPSGPVESSLPAPALEATPREGRGSQRAATTSSHSNPVSLKLGYARPLRQTLACGPLGFVRLLEPGFEAVSYTTWQSTLRRPRGAFTHVVEQPGYSFLLVGRESSLAYYQANVRLTQLSHFPALGPLRIWADAQSRERLWVHYLKDDAVHHFELPRDVHLPARLLHSISLPNFDGRRLIRLQGGQWLFGAHGEFAEAPRLRWTDGRHQLWLEGGWEGVALVAGQAMNFWAVYPERVVSHRMEPLDKAIQVQASMLQGDPWGAVSQGDRLAVLSHRVVDGRRRWSAQVVTPARTHHVEFPDLEDPGTPEFATQLTLCLPPERTLVVVGSSRDVRVVDYVTQKTLFRRP